VNARLSSFLESDDLALGNYAGIASAAVDGLSGRLDIPEVICLVETELGDMSG
jgi:hypothetical protein